MNETAVVLAVGAIVYSAIVVIMAWKIFQYWRKIP